MTTQLFLLTPELKLNWIVRLDLERVRRSMPDDEGAPIDEEVVYRFLAAIGVRRKDEDWWWATDEALVNFVDGEVLEKRPATCRHARGAGGK